MGKNKKNRNRGKYTEDQLRTKQLIKDKEAEAIDLFKKELDKTQGCYLDKKLDLVKERSKATYIRVFPSCKRCYGRGYLGFNINTLHIIPCGCIVERLEPMTKEEKIAEDKERELSEKEANDKTSVDTEKVTE